MALPGAARGPHHGMAAQRKGPRWWRIANTPTQGSVPEVPWEQGPLQSRTGVTELGPAGPAAWLTGPQVHRRPGLRRWCRPYWVPRRRQWGLWVRPVASAPVRCRGVSWANEPLMSAGAASVRRRTRRSATGIGRDPRCNATGALNGCASLLGVGRGDPLARPHMFLAARAPALSVLVVAFRQHPGNRGSGVAAQRPRVTRGGSRDTVSTPCGSPSSVPAEPHPTLRETPAVSTGRGLVAR